MRTQLNITHHGGIITTYHTSGKLYVMDDFGNAVPLQGNTLMEFCRFILSCFDYGIPYPEEL